MTAVPAAVSLVLALTVGWLVPAAVMRALPSVVEPGALSRPNFRGRQVAPSLGMAWVIWVIALAAVQAVCDLLLSITGGTAGLGEVMERFWTTPLALPFFVVPFMLVAGCAVLGLADDVFGEAGAAGGTGAPRGFRGHLAALGRWRVTTGMLKMLGIGALAFFYGVSAAEGVLGRSALPEGWSGSAGALVGTAVLAALVIALSANLLNLLDVRPGRALKAYMILVPLPAVMLALAATASYNEQIAGFAAEAGALALTTWEGVATAAALLIVLLGPALGVWRFDLGERAMLGDMGSNVMGAIVGYLLTAVLPLGGLAAAAAFLLGLNLLSEKVSFSAVIDRTRPLRWLDRLGRGRVDGAQSSVSAPAGGETSSPPVTPVRYHSDEGDDGED